MVTITRSGYIKRTHIEAYRSQKRGGKGVTGMETKEEDIVEDLFVASTHSSLLFFTNRGKVHWLKVHEIPEGGRQAKGKAMVNLLSLAEGERVATCVPVRDFEAGGYILFATRQGKVKKTELSAFSHPRAGGIIAITLDEGDEVVVARRTDGAREILLSTKAGMIIRFAEEEIRPLSRTAGGVRGIDVEDGDQVIAAAVVQEGAMVLTVTARGYGKRTPLEEYRLQGRAGKGIIDIKTGGRNGSVVGMLQVREGDDVLVVTTKGKIIRVHAADVSAQGRNTMGVRIIGLDADDQAGSIARVEAEQTAAEPAANPRPSSEGVRPRRDDAASLLSRGRWTATCAPAIAGRQRCEGRRGGRRWLARAETRARHPVDPRAARRRAGGPCDAGGAELVPEILQADETRRRLLTESETLKAAAEPRLRGHRGGPAPRRRCLGGDGPHARGRGPHQGARCRRARGRRAP